MQDKQPALTIEVKHTGARPPAHQRWVNRQNKTTLKELWQQRATREIRHIFERDLDFSFRVFRVVCG
jgi:hypothetical protein